jgi:hypothetical protein
MMTRIVRLPYLEMKFVNEFPPFASVVLFQSLLDFYNLNKINDRDIEFIISVRIFFYYLLL